MEFLENKNLKFWRIAILIFLIFFVESCNENPTEFYNNNAIKLVLSYQNKKDSTIYNTIFKGSLYGPIDSLRMKVPEMFLFGVSNKTFIRYAFPDTFTYAKKEYIIEQELRSGTYDIYMMLQCINNEDIFSDTIHIYIP